MMDWLQEYAEVLSALGTLLMMLAWVIYAQFGIITYIRQRRPRIVIDQTADHSINTRFVIVNLSQLPVYISGIIVVVRRGEDEIMHKIQNYQRSNSDDSEDGSEDFEHVEKTLRHGTLDVGDLLLMGSSDQTLSWLLDDEAEDADQSRGQRLRNALIEVDDFEFRVVAMAGSEDKPVASARKFAIEQDDEHRDIRIVPKDGSTRHYSSWRYRHVALEWSEQLRQMHS